MKKEIILQEEQAIRSLLERYTTAVNLRDWDTYRKCWSAHAVWDLWEPLNVKKEGIEAIMKEVMATVETLELFVQMTHSIAISEVSESTAKAIVTLNEIGKPFKGSSFPFPSMYILAIYFDDLVKENGQWVFAKRTYKVAYWDTNTLQGAIYQQGWMTKEKVNA